MTIGQIKRGMEIVYQIDIWEKRYSCYQEHGPSHVSITMYESERITFDGTDDILSNKFFKIMCLKYEELCKTKIDSLKRELESL